MAVTKCFVIFILHFMFIGFSYVDGNPVSADSTSSAFYYLLNYGYIHKKENQDTAQLLSEEAVTKAVKDFQVFAGLQPTGDLDAETVELMNTPRCGVKDKLGPANIVKRKKRYALQGSKWSVKTLTYRISKYPSSGRLPKDRIDAEIKSAFQLWADVADIKFEKKETGSVHVDIRFEQGEHGDGDPFDGPGGTLAHAFFPQYGGDAHFDDQEYWTINEFRGTNLRQTAAHELGHSLGLSHSDVRSALMAPFYRGWDPNLQLNRDDIEAVQALYGKTKQNIDTPSSTTESTTTAKPQIAFPSDPSPGVANGGALCESDRVDEIFNTENGDYFVFQADQYWKLTEESVAPGYPRKISSDWPGLPNDIDAAVTWTDNGMTYFFKGNQYWKFHNMDAQEGYPKLMSDGFPGIPSDVDTAFVWGGNGKIYFFKDSNYYKFDPTRKIPVSADYPKDIHNWGLPGKLDAAVKWINKYTYFFRNGQYYRFNDRKFEMDSGDPPFPRPTGKWWFGCQESNNVRFSVFANRDNNVFSIKALKKSEARSIAVDHFVEEGEETLDASDPDS